MKKLFSGKKRGGDMRSLHSVLRAEQIKGKVFTKMQKTACWMTGILSVLLLLTWGGHWLIQKFLENPKYTVSQIDVRVKGKIRKEHILAWAAVPPRSNIFSLDIRALQRRIESQPVVRSATIERRMPNRIEIEVIERVPLARLVTKTSVGGLEGHVFTIDREGVVMRTRQGENLRHLPTICGVPPLDAIPGRKMTSKEVYCALYLLEIVERSPMKGEFDFKHVDISGGELLQVALGSGGKIKFIADSNQLPAQLERFQQLVLYCQQHKKRLGTADMTVKRNVPVTFMPES